MYMTVLLYLFDISGKPPQTQGLYTVASRVFGNELKGGRVGEHTNNKGASYIEESGGYLPQEILKTRTPQIPFPMNKFCTFYTTSGSWDLDVDLLI